MDKLGTGDPVVVTRKFAGSAAVAESVEGEVIVSGVITLIVTVWVAGLFPFEATRVT
jgi:hypothetical protein